MSADREQECPSAHTADQLEDSAGGHLAIAAGARSLAEQMRAGGFSTLGEMMKARGGGPE